jgi:hypothetical protein
MKERTKCQVLDADGKKCTRLAQADFPLHLHPEFYRGWVKVAVCKKHAEELIH